MACRSNGLPLRVRCPSAFTGGPGDVGHALSGQLEDPLHGRRGRRVDRRWPRLLAGSHRQRAAQVLAAPAWRRFARLTLSERSAAYFAACAEAKPTSISFVTNSSSVHGAQRDAAAAEVVEQLADGARFVCACRSRGQTSPTCSPTAPALRAVGSLDGRGDRGSQLGAAVLLRPAVAVVGEGADHEQSPPYSCASRSRTFGDLACRSSPGRGGPSSERRVDHTGVIGSTSQPQLRPPSHLLRVRLRHRPEAVVPRASGPRPTCDNATASRSKQHSTSGLPPWWAQGVVQAPLEVGSRRCDRGGPGKRPSYSGQGRSRPKTPYRREAA